MTDLLLKQQQMYKVQFVSNRTKICFVRYLVLTDNSEEEIKKMLLTSLENISIISINYVYPVFSLIDESKGTIFPPENHLEHFWIDASEIVVTVYCKRSTISFSIITEVEYSEEILIVELSKHFNDVLEIELYKWNECWIKREVDERLIE